MTDTRLLAHDLRNKIGIIQANLVMLSTAPPAAEAGEMLGDCLVAATAIANIANTLDGGVSPGPIVIVPDEEITAEVCSAHGVRVNHVRVPGGTYCGCCGTPTFGKWCPGCSRPPLIGEGR